MIGIKDIAMEGWPYSTGRHQPFMERGANI